MKKKLLSVIAALAALALLASCAPASSSPASAAALTGPTGMGMVKLLGSEDYDLSLLTNPDEISPKIISGDVSIAAIPSNLASVIYSKTKGAIRVVAVNTTGVMYIVENGDTVTSLADLSGKTIYSTGQGATPEYALKSILEQNGIKDVTIQFMGAHADLANAVAAGDVKLALLPEPFVSTVLSKNAGVKVKIDINDEWKSLYGQDAGIPMGVTVVSKDFAQDKAAMDKLIADCSASVGYVNSDPQAAADIAEAKIVGSKEVAAAAIPRCGISFITGQQCKDMLNDYFTLMYESNPASIGGAVPDDVFYYMP